MSNSGKNIYASATFKSVERDIAFLQERLELMRHQNKQNKVLLETYRDMLDCRLSVRTLLIKKYSNLTNNRTTPFAAS